MNGARPMLLLAMPVTLFVWLGFVVAGPVGAAVAVPGLATLVAVALRRGDRILLALHRARRVDAARCPELVGLVARLAARAAMPCPAVHVIESAHPNAFSTGRDPAHAAIALTTGLLGMLGRTEIEGVVAHELAHIRNRDTAIMTAAAAMVGAIAVLAGAGLLFGDRQRGGIMALLLAPVAGLVLLLAIGREREHAADRLAGRICGDPLALASALARLAGGATRVPNPVLARNPGVAALYVVPAGGGLFPTHPATASRIARLRTQAIELRLMRRGPARASVPLCRRNG